MHFQHKVGDGTDSTGPAAAAPDFVFSVFGPAGGSAAPETRVFIGELYEGHGSITTLLEDYF